MGNMGRRYQAIPGHLGVASIGVDVGQNIPVDQGFDSIIIASPTLLHVHHVLELSQFDVPMLVEKPLATDLVAVCAACDVLERRQVRVRQVNQYAYLVRPEDVGSTYYNYFRTGSDGLYWDTISIIALARGDVKVASDSPVWRCQINGRKLGLGQMDEAYIMMIKDFVERPPQQPETGYIRSAHAKTALAIGRAKDE
jgi:hypothetical protein